VALRPGGTAKYPAVQTNLILIPIPFLIAYAIANLVVLVLYAADKRSARLRQRRISERTLLLSAVAGPFGALGGMSAFHHKTRKLRFVVAVPLLVTLHGAIGVALLTPGLV